MKKISQIRGDTGREGLQQVAEEIRNTEESGTKKEKITEKAVVKNSNIFITICKYIIKGTGYLCLFLVPILSYYLFEYVTENLANISAFSHHFHTEFLPPLYQNPNPKSSAKAMSMMTGCLHCSRPLSSS